MILIHLILNIYEPKPILMSSFRIYPLKYSVFWQTPSSYNDTLSSIDATIVLIIVQQHLLLRFEGTPQSQMILVVVSFLSLTLNSMVKFW